jgi:hypothetical protein
MWLVSQEEKKKKASLFALGNIQIFGPQVKLQLQV